MERLRVLHQHLITPVNSRVPFGKLARETPRPTGLRANHSMECLVQLDLNEHNLLRVLPRFWIPPTTFTRQTPFLNSMR